MLELADRYEVPVRSPRAVSHVLPEQFPSAPAVHFARQTVRDAISRHPARVVRICRLLVPHPVEQAIRTIETTNVRYPDYLVDTFWGNPTSENLTHILDNLPLGCSELCLHLGDAMYWAPLPYGISEAYSAIRVRELSVVLASERLAGSEKATLIPLRWQEYRSVTFREYVAQREALAAPGK